MQSEAEPMELCELAADAQSLSLVSPLGWAVLEVNAQTSPRSANDFFHRFRPSRCRDSEVKWISVVNTTRPRLEQGDTHAMVTEWQWMCQQGHADVKTLHELARKYNVLSGKWMVFCSHHEVDVVWQNVATAVGKGQLGSCVKVSPVSTVGKAGHVICVYADNYFDSEDVRRIRQELWHLGLTAKLKFKPDVYTHCGIYSGNAWGISHFAFGD